MGNLVYLIYLLLCFCSHTTSGVVKNRKSKLVFEGHKSEKYSSRFPVYWNDTWKLMVVFVLSLGWSLVNKTYVLCLIYHDKRNPQHQIISHLIASQIIKNDTLNFFLIIHQSIANYYSLRNILNILNKLSVVINPV